MGSRNGQHVHFEYGMGCRRRNALDCAAGRQPTLRSARSFVRDGPHLRLACRQGRLLVTRRDLQVLLEDMFRDQFVGDVRHQFPSHGIACLKALAQLLRAAQ